MKKKFRNIVLGAASLTIIPFAVISCSNKGTSIKETTRNYLRPFPAFKSLEADKQDKILQLTEELRNTLIDYYTKHQIEIEAIETKEGQKIGNLPEYSKISNIINQIGKYIFELQMEMNLPPQNTKAVYNKVISFIAKEASTQKIGSLIKNNPF